MPAPVHLPQAPYLDAIVQTDQGIVQLIAVEKIRDATLRKSVPESTIGTLIESRSSSMTMPESENGSRDGGRAARDRGIAREPDRAGPDAVGSQLISARCGSE